VKLVPDDLDLLEVVVEQQLQHDPVDAGGREGGQVL
jgi:hypothetical protein